MTGYTSSAGTSSPTVRVITPYSGFRPHPRRVTGSTTTSARRLKAWIVRSIMIATAAFAFLDLLLLASGGHH